MSIVLNILKRLDISTLDQSIDKCQSHMYEHAVSEDAVHLYNMYIVQL